MKIDLQTCSEEELWKYIAVELGKNEIDVKKKKSWISIMTFFMS